MSHIFTVHLYQCDWARKQIMLIIFSMLNVNTSRYCCKVLFSIFLQRYLPCRLFLCLQHAKVVLLTVINKTFHVTVLTLSFVYQAQVVQSVVSLTISLRVISLTVLADSIYNILIFFAEKCE